MKTWGWKSDMETSSETLKEEKVWWLNAERKDSIRSVREAEAAAGSWREGNYISWDGKCGWGEGADLEKELLWQTKRIQEASMGKKSDTTEVR